MKTILAVLILLFSITTVSAVDKEPFKPVSEIGQYQDDIWICWIETVGKACMFIGKVELLSMVLYEDTSKVGDSNRKTLIKYVNLDDDDFRNRSGLDTLKGSLGHSNRYIWTCWYTAGIPNCLESPKDIMINMALYRKYYKNFPGESNTVRFSMPEEKDPSLP